MRVDAKVDDIDARRFCCPSVRSGDRDPSFPLRKRRGDGESKMMIVERSSDEVPGQMAVEKNTTKRSVAEWMQL